MRLANGLRFTNIPALYTLVRSYHEIAPCLVGSENEGRAFDVPSLVLNAGSAAAEWDWLRQTKLDDILEEVAAHAESHPEWLGRTQN
jgi:hypothetical protein